MIIFGPFRVKEPRLSENRNHFRPKWLPLSQHASSTNKQLYRREGLKTLCSISFLLKRVMRSTSECSHSISINIDGQRQERVGAHNDQVYMYSAFTLLFPYPILYEDLKRKQKTVGTWYVSQIVNSVRPGNGGTIFPKTVLYGTLCVERLKNTSFPDGLHLFFFHTLTIIHSPSTSE